MSDTHYLQLRHGLVISPSSTALRKPTPTSSRILVIGAGVTGLVTAWVLLDLGYKVTILSKDWVNNSLIPGKRLTSQIAGALWEYPPAVCGSHTNETSLRRSKEWAMISYRALRELIGMEVGKDIGIKMVRSTFFFPQEIEKDETQYKKMREIETSGVNGFKRDPGLIASHGVSPAYGAADAYELQAPVIDTDQAMHWLTSLVRAKGATFVTETLTRDLLDVESSLRSQFKADAIVNCSGLASQILAADDLCYPLRGGLLRYINDGTSFPKIRSALAISADVSQAESDIVFILPRNNNTLIVGGFAERDEWELDCTLESRVMQRMKARAENFIPALKNGKLDDEYPVAQGLRPARDQNVRLERETRNPRSRIVHSYGHGGSGWSLSFGCAAEVAEIVSKMLENNKRVAISTKLRARL